jgi:L-lactate utilization protein LutB
LTPEPTSKKSKKLNPKRINLKLSLKKENKEGLKNPIPRTAPERATRHHFQKFLKKTREFPSEEYRDKARAIKEDCLRQLSELIARFTQEATESGLEVTQDRTSQEVIEGILKNTTPIL